MNCCFKSCMFAAFCRQLIANIVKIMPAVIQMLSVLVGYIGCKKQQAWHTAWNKYS